MIERKGGHEAKDKKKNTDGEKSRVVEQMRMCQKAGFGGKFRGRQGRERARQRRRQGEIRMCQEEQK